IGRDSQIIGRKELEFAVRRKKVVHGSVHDYLARGRIGIAGQTVGCAASDQSQRRLLKRAGQSIEPARSRNAVIVGKGKVFTLGLLGAGVTGGCRSRVGLAYPYRQTIESIEIRRVERWLAPIVYDDNLEARFRIVQPCQGAKTGSKFTR